MPRMEVYPRDRRQKSGEPLANTDGDESGQKESLVPQVRFNMMECLDQ